MSRVIVLFSALAFMAAPVALAQEDNEPTIYSVDRDTNLLQKDERFCREKYDAIGIDLRFDPAKNGLVYRCKQLRSIERNRSNQGSRSFSRLRSRRLQARIVSLGDSIRARSESRILESRRTQTNIYQNIRRTRGVLEADSLLQLRNIRLNQRRAIRTSERANRPLTGRGNPLSTFERRRKAGAVCRGLRGDERNVCIRSIMAGEEYPPES